jgi:hypothetical protein
MFLHSSAQIKIHRAAVTHGWRVHAHNGSDTNPNYLTTKIEYRRGSRDFVIVSFWGTGSRFRRGVHPQGCLPTVGAVTDRLSQSFRGAQGEVPPRPAKPYLVAVWSDVERFADRADACGYAETAAFPDALVRLYSWEGGAFCEVSVWNG